MHKVEVKFGPEITKEEGVTGRTIFEVTGSLAADGPRELLPEGAKFTGVEGTIERGPAGDAIFCLSGIVKLPKPSKEKKAKPEGDKEEPLI